MKTAATPLGLMSASALSSGIAARLLLVQRGRAPRAGQWALPGGVQELGETLFETATREVLEETGIAIEPLAIITALDLIERDEDGVRYHYTLVEITARYAGGEAMAKDDAADVRWVAPDEIATLDAWEQVGHMVALSQDPEGRDR